MTVFRVWAPRPAAVELALGGERRPMTRDPDDWWSLDVPEAGAGSDYAFVLDGAGPFPDPRSPWQPEGVHGPSRLVDHAAYPWTDHGFEPVPLAQAAFYELHVGTFSAAGTFEGAIDQLDHLVTLGVTHVELMPVVEAPGDRGWGYDGVDLFAPHHAYGGPEGLKRLVDACHDRGLAVILDVVYNHLGPDGNYLARFGPYFSPRYTTPWGEAVNFDAAGADEVRAFVLDNVRLWVLDYHVDGLRLDAVHELFDRSAVHILEEMAATVHELGRSMGRRACLIAESDLNDPRLVREVAAGGHGLDAQWLDDFRHALHVALTGETDVFSAQYQGLADLAYSLSRGYVFDGRFSSFRGRRHGRPAGDVPTTRFVSFLQNHDQAGNRPFGERSSMLLSTEQLRVAAGLVVLGPYLPLLFAGEEWAASTPFLYFTDHVDPRLADAVRAGRQAEFGHLASGGRELPDPQDRASFERSRLDWSEAGREPGATMLAWHRTLLAFRRDHDAFRSGSHPAVRFDTAEGWLTADYGDVVIGASLGDRPASAPLAPGRGWEVALASRDDIRVEDGILCLPPWSFAALT